MTYKRVIDLLYANKTDKFKPERRKCYSEVSRKQNFPALKSVDLTVTNPSSMNGAGAIHSEGQFFLEYSQTDQIPE